MQEKLPVTPSIPEQINPVVQVNNQKPKANSYVVILLSTLLFISASIAGFFAFQTQKLVKELTALKTEPTVKTTIDPMADWKTYTNSDLGITFNYPTNWLVTDQKDNVSVETEYKSPDGLSGEQILRIQHGERLDKVLEFESNITKDPVELAELNVGGNLFPIIKTHFGSGTSSGYGTCVDGGEITSYLFEPKPNFVFTLSKYDEKGCSKDGSTFERRKTSDLEIEITKKILSTLKFTDTESTADWKTYNNEGSFTFKYPKEYTESGMGIISPLNKVRNKKDSTLQNGELKLEFYPEEFDGITTLESCWQDHNSGGGRITGKSTVKVGGKNYETILWEGEGTGEFLCITNKEYRILIMKYPAETTRQNEYVDILSSFKFTN